MNCLRIGLVVLGCLILNACNATKAVIDQPTPAINSALTQQQAQARQARISDVSYQYQLDITDPQQLRGHAQLSFSLTDNREPIKIDLATAQVSQFTLNGRPLYPNYDNQVFTLPARLLNSGRNQITLHYQRPYSTEPDGLYRLQDPIDGQDYLFSFLKPSSAKKLFPLFDQLDIRATFSLQVTAPSSWQVISTTAAVEVIEEQQARRWQFAQTETISPYQFSLHAGPFQFWQQQGQPSLGLYVRQSQVQQVEPQQFFNRTQASIEKLAQRLGVDYPFGQYNQVLVPVSIPFAMESSATNLVNERDFWQQQQQQSQQPILSDLTRQWFGNLVAIKWWDQQWLNESMALYISQQLTDDAHQSAVPQHTFDKQQAYNEDRLVSSHALQPSAINPNSPLQHVDAITQQKGLSSLKQLNHLIGDRAFYQGIQDFLTQYRFQSTPSESFLDTLAKAAKTDLTPWYQQWVLSSGLNTLKAEFQCDNNRISRFVLHQSGLDSPQDNFKSQTVKIGLFTKGRNALHRNSTVVVTYDGATTDVKRLVGSRCPDLVYPNYQDWGYVNVELDNKSLQTALFEIGKLQDDQLRSMLWQGLWNSVLQGQLSLQQYFGAIFVNLPSETEPQVLAQVLNQLKQAKVYLEQMQPLHQRYARQALNGVEQMSLRLAMQNSANTTLRDLWFEQYIHFATSLSAQHHLAKLLNGKEGFEGLQLPQQQRWGILIHLSRYDYPNINRLLNQESQRDNSDSGANYLLAAKASQRQSQQKRRWLNKVMQQTTPTTPTQFVQLATVMQHLYPSEQKALSQATAEERLAQLEQLDSHRDEKFMALYSQYLLPMSCSYNGKQRLQNTLTQQAQLSTVSQRGLKLAIQAEQQCISISERMLKHGT
ncbi:aminopeptidase N [Shewanella sp. Scap07]|uniref:aminopeptidase N n=1 Tax=Shewanella sp. Scap07 TaxID=2589987 RepID=UPI0015BAF31B|nr:aminopeptidase N [Shewanella sp. Scap07]